MEKRLIIVIMVFCAILTVKAQKISISVKGGYAFGVNKTYGANTNSFTSLINENYSNSIATVKPVNYSLGSGIPINVAFGYYLNKNISINLGVFYSIGKEFYGEFTGDGANSSYRKITLKSSYLGFSPSIKLFYPLNDKINLYTEVGVSIAKPQVIFEGYTEETDYYDPSIRHIYKENYKIYGNLCVGGNLGLGINYKITDLISVNFDVSHLSMQYSPANATLTKYEIDGTDYTEDRSVSQSEYVFVDELTDGDNKGDNPTKVLSFAYSYSNISLNLGVSFYF